MTTMYNLTLPITAETDAKVIDELRALPFPTRILFNMELSELTVLCEVSHAADVERVLAPYV
jgi:hypothetical protein